MAPSPPELRMIFSLSLDLNFTWLYLYYLLLAIYRRVRHFVTFNQTSRIEPQITGACDLNGEGCTTVEMTLGDPKCAGCGSSTDISLIPP